MPKTVQFTLPMALSTVCLTFALTACGGGGDEPAVPDTEAAQAVAQADTAQAAGSGGVATASSATRLSFKVPLSQMTQVATPFDTPHEAQGAGVPQDFDWAQASRLRAGNSVPAGIGAVTGWGQLFWIQGAPQDQAAEIRGNQTLLCEGPTRRWTRVQGGGIEGAAFRPDFGNNEAAPAQTVAVLDATRVRMPADRAYHWWPQGGRAALPGSQVCGLVVLFEARAVATDGSTLPASAAPSLLIGAGADYWTSVSAPWQNHQTNPGLALGQLRKLTPDWRWYGLSTASSADIATLQSSGFLDRTVP